MKNKIYLQLFAKTSTSGGSTSTTHQEEYGGSSSHTEGGSSSHTEGGSHSETQTHSETRAHSEGGAHGESSGVVYASGKVEDRTQAQREKYDNDYAQGQKVTDTYNRLQETLDGKPTFQSQYESKLNDLYNSIMNREKFSYDFNQDQMYQMYKDNYTRQGKQAMEDTIGRANAANGGYGSSYSQSAGQQTYQDYLQRVNDIIPTLRDQAYQQYLDEGNELLTKYNVTGDAYNREYGQYRDSVADWQADRSFEQANYQDERNFDYNQYAQERNYWNQEYWNERNSAQSNQQVSDENNWNDSQSVTNGWSVTDESHWEDTQTAFWENVDSTNWGGLTSTTNTSNWNNSMSMSSGGGSGSSKAKATDWSGLNKMNWNENAPNSYAPLTDAERKARFSSFTNGIDTGTEAGQSIEKAYKNLSWSSALKDSQKRENILSTLYSTQNTTIPDVMEDLADRYDLTDKDLDALAQWLRYMRG